MFQSGGNNISPLAIEKKLADEGLGKFDLTLVAKSDGRLGAIPVLVVAGASRPDLALLLPTINRVLTKIARPREIYWSGSRKFGVKMHRQQLALDISQKRLERIWPKPK